MDRFKARVLELRSRHGIAMSAAWSWARSEQAGDSLPLTWKATRGASCGYEGVWPHPHFMVRVRAELDPDPVGPDLGTWHRRPVPGSIAEPVSGGEGRPRLWFLPAEGHEDLRYLYRKDHGKHEADVRARAERRRMMTQSLQPDWLDYVVTVTVYAAGVELARASLGSVSISFDDPAEKATLKAVVPDLVAEAVSEAKTKLGQLAQCYEAVADPPEHVCTGCGRAYDWGL